MESKEQQAIDVASSIVQHYFQHLIDQILVTFTCHHQGIKNGEEHSYQASNNRLIFIIDKRLQDQSWLLTNVQLTVHRLSSSVLSFNDFLLNGSKDILSLFIEHFHFDGVSRLHKRSLYLTLIDLFEHSLFS